MRYKAIYFYLPIHLSQIGARTHLFNIDSEPQIIPVSSVDGENYNSPEGYHYYRVGSTDIFRLSYYDYTSQSSSFVKIVKETDPMFNFDYATILCVDDNALHNHNILKEGFEELVARFVDKEVLDLKR